MSRMKLLISWKLISDMHTSRIANVHSSTPGKDRCSLVSDPIQWLRATCGWVFLEVVSSLMEACESQQQLHGDGLHQFVDDSLSLSLSLSSWLPLLECIRVHSRTPVLSWGCLLQRVGRTDVHAKNQISPSIPFDKTLTCTGHRQTQIHTDRQTDRQTDTGHNYSTGRVRENVCNSSKNVKSDVFWILKNTLKRKKNVHTLSEATWSPRSLINITESQ